MVNTSEMAAFVESLAGAGEMVPVIIPTVLGVSAAEVAKQVVAITSNAGSKSIPGTVHLESVEGGTCVVAGGDDCEIAQLWDSGNKGSRRNGKTFRHPVFGDMEVWKVQPRTPFSDPAITAAAAVMDSACESAVNSIADKVCGSGL